MMGVVGNQGLAVCPRRKREVAAGVCHKVVLLHLNTENVIDLVALRHLAKVNSTSRVAEIVWLVSSVKRIRKEISERGDCKGWVRRYSLTPFIFLEFSSHILT